MFISPPEIITEQESPAMELFNRSKRTVLESIFPKNSSILKESFRERDEKRQIIEALNGSVELLNKAYAHRAHSPIRLTVLDVPRAAYGIHDDVGAMFDPQFSLEDEGIYYHGAIILGTDLLTQKNSWKGSPFSQSLRKNLGLANLTKMVLFHEAGHYLDYLKGNKLLQTATQEEIAWENLIGGAALKKYMCGWYGVGKEGSINEQLKNKFKEHVADCWSCVLLAQEVPGLSLQKTTDALKSARSSMHLGNAEHLYATHYSLDRLMSNKNSLPLNNAKDIANLVHLSSQQGFCQNVLAVIEDKEKQEIARSIIADVGPGPQSLEASLKSTIKKFKP